MQVSSWGYRAVGVSVVSGEGLDELTDVLAGRVTVVAGPSGAGKSSIINALQLRSLGLEGGLLDAMAAQPSGAADSKEEEGGEKEEECCSADGEDSGTDEEDEERQQDGAQPAAAGDQKAEGMGHGQQRQPGGSSSAGSSLQLPADLELQAVGNVSQRIGRGKHTTRNVTLIELEGRAGGSGGGVEGSGDASGSNGSSSSSSSSSSGGSSRGGGGLVVDTPGFNQPDLSFPSSELGMHFPEIRRLTETDRCA